MRVSLLLPILLVSCLFKAQSQDSTRQKKLSLVPIPAVFYTPETRLGYGVLLSGVFRIGQDEESTRKSNAQVLGAYTLNKQTIFQSSHNLFTNEERYNLNGRLNYLDFPIFYYGVGNDTKASFEESIEYEVVEFNERVVRQFKKNWFIGLQYQFTNLYNLSFTPTVLNEDSARLYNDQGKNSGLGLAIIHDSRDNVLNATKGYFLQVTSLHNGGRLGGEFNFSRYVLDYRRYWKLKDGSVLAGQAFSQLNFGEVPFREMSQMGGDVLMRGYYSGRFRDKHYLATQFEWRKTVINWFGIALFGGVGDVADSPSNFTLDTFKYTVGGGLRFMVNKKERLNIRIDYGIGKETSGFYFAFAEAF